MEIKIVGSLSGIEEVEEIEHIARVFAYEQRIIILAKEARRKMVALNEAENFIDSEISKMMIGSESLNEKKAKKSDESFFRRLISNLTGTLRKD
jgi:hypothetical protein